MSKKVSLRSTKKSRLEEAKKELESEKLEEEKKEMKQTTVILEKDLFYSIKEVALNRKKSGVEPSTVAGIIRQSLLDIVKKEGN